MSSASLASTPTLKRVRPSYHSVFRPFPLPQTFHQWFYLGFLQGVGAGFIDGGANFGIAYAMYHGQKVVKMWVFSKNTIAGDLGVTPIIQCAMSMVITSTLVHTDLHHKAIRPLPFVYPHVDHLPDPQIFIDKILRRKPKQRQPGGIEGPAGASAVGAPYSATDGTTTTAVSEKPSPEFSDKHGFSYYYWMLVRFIFEGTENNMMLARVGVGKWFGRFFWTLAQGAAIGIVFGLPLWCLAVLILGPIYGNGNMGNKWAPQVIKGVYGAIVGWITNPVIATLALGSQAESHLIVVPEGDEEAEVEGVTDTEPGIETILEEGEPETTEAGGDVHKSEKTGFQTPYRANSTGQLRQDATGRLHRTTPPDTRKRSGTLTTPSLSRGTSVALTSATPGTPSGRGRAGSFSRPPLVANASHLCQLCDLPQPVVPVAGPVTPTAPAATPNRPNRPRAFTAGSFVSTSTQFTYALGGTGGRAQRQGRSRSNTATSQWSMGAVSDLQPPGRGRANSGYSAASSPGVRATTPGTHTQTRDRALSVVSATGATVTSSYGRASPSGVSVATRDVSYLNLNQGRDNAPPATRTDAARSTAGGAEEFFTPSTDVTHDVFGPTPVLTLQRPSMDVNPDERPGRL